MNINYIPVSYTHLDVYKRQIIRPANYAEGVPGHGYGIYECKGKKIAVIDLIGRTDMGILSENPNSDKYSAPSFAYNFTLDKSPGRLLFLQLHKKMCIRDSLYSFLLLILVKLPLTFQVHFLQQYLL